MFPLARTVIVLLLAAALPSAVRGQVDSARGTIVDGRNSPVEGVHVRLVNPRDTTEAYIATTQADGTFLFSGIPPKSYRLEATAVGRRKIVQTVQIGARSSTVGKLVMAEAPIAIGEVVVEGRIPPAVQNGDTTEFNASAFKTNRDATAEDLLTKMPGITVNQGTVTAGGENVQRVLVDGKPFFGDDPTLALRNLPADVIDKIQVFDQMSDQAQFTGFDDGQSVKALNIQTRRARREMEFGKFTAGYGDDRRYEAGGNANSFEGSRRLSVLGLSNDINEQNFTTQDLLGVVSAGNQVRTPGQAQTRRGNRNGGGRGSFQFPGSGGRGSGQPLIGQQQGINTTTMLGANYSDSAAANLFTQASYFVNRTDNENQQQLSREYLLGSDVTGTYNQFTDGASKNFNHRVNARVDYTADTTNFLTVLPQLYFQSNRSNNSVTAGSFQDAAASTAQTSTASLNAGYDLSGHIVYRHKLEVPGRTVSLDVGVNANRKHATGSTNASQQSTAGSAIERDTVDQQGSYLANGHTLSANLVYTEPGWGGGLIQISYAPSFTRNTADKNTLDFDPVTQTYSRPDIPLSNSTMSDYSAQNGGVGYRWRSGGLNVMGSIAYQEATLRGVQSLTTGQEVQRRFGAFLPSVLLQYAMEDHRSLRLFYRTSMRPPTIAQLQDVIDNSNPLLLTSGNPDLIPTYTHSFVSRYGQTSVDRAQSMFILLSATSSAHYIGNSTIIPSRDTVLANGRTLAQGVQLTTPANLDGYWNVRSFFTYGFPFELAGSTLNLNSGVTYTRTPGIVNGARNVANTCSFSQGFVMGSNISENMDFTISYTGNYTIARNSLPSNSNYYSHSAGLKWTWTFWDGVVLRNDVSSALTSGLSSGYNQNVVLWNISLAQKVFENRSGEIKLGVADLLGQNRNLSRAVTDTYVEDTRNEALQRYVMASFTYTFR